MIRKNLLQQNSLKTRITLFTLLIFLVSLWSFGYAISHSLRGDMEKVLGEQQFAIADLMAANIDDEIDSRVTALQQIAQNIEKRNLFSASELQNFLEDRAIFQAMFNGGAFVTDHDGLAIASVPSDLGRIGINFLDRDYIAETLSEGQPTIGRPVIGRQIQTPIFGIGVPIKNKAGEITAVLAGIIDLNQSNFMDRIERNHLRTSSSYLLIDATNRVIVASSNKNRQMELLPSPTINATLDKFIDGFEGSDVFINPRGFEVISGVKHLSSTNWYVAVSLPTTVAFASIDSMERRIFFMTLILTFLSGGLTWWVLVRQLSPLQVTAQKLAQLADPASKLEPLPISRQDEIGQLVSGFNRLLAELVARQETLKESEERYRTVFRTSPDAVSLTQLKDGKFLDINDGYTRIFGWERQEIIGKTSLDIGIWASLTERESFISRLELHRSCERFETRFVSHDGRIVHALVSSNTLSLNGEECILSVTQDITAKKIASDQIEYLEYFDALTGLANLRLLMQRLSLAIEEHKNLQYLGVLLHIDLDDFKSLNDSFGHDKGDVWLKEVAKRIKEVVPESDFVARIGGDKFAVLLSGLSLHSDATISSIEKVAQSIILSIHQPFSIDNTQHHGSCCIGIALIANAQESGNTLLKHAELAMYQAKQMGRGTFQFFNVGMQEIVSARVSLEADLRESIKNQDFVLYYQRQLNANNELIGFEALLRWHHPTRGIVLPYQFITAAEQCGLVLSLGRWVLETACLQLARWALDPEKSHLTISVNVSATQFHETDYVEQVLDILKQTKAPSHRLKLELTESVLVSEIENLITKMTVLKSHGVGFSLDDFGTGFSSLSYLQRLPLDQLKIDQGFIKNIVTSGSDAAIVQTIVTLGTNLGLSVIAEGVETESQRARLFELGCALYQGYLFEKPAPIDELIY